MLGTGQGSGRPGGTAGPRRQAPRTTSRYSHASTKAATAALQARAAADDQLAARYRRGTQRGTVAPADLGEETLAHEKGDGRVAQLDRALPSGAVKESIIPCKKQGILISSGSQKSQQKRIETQPNWHGASYENLDRVRRAWGALRVV